MQREQEGCAKAGAAVGLAVLALCGSFLFWVDGQARARRTYPEPGGAGAPTAYRVGSQAEVYGLYRQTGLWGARAVHLNRFFNTIEYKPPAEGRTRPFPIRTHDIRPAYAAGVDSHSWLFIASRTGMVRKVTTVLPDTVFIQRLADFRDDPAFKVSGNAVRGYIYGTPVSIFPLGFFPAVREPVVVDVDAGFFTDDTDPVGLAAVLRERCPDIRMLVLVDSHDEPEVTDGMRRKLDIFGTAMAGAYGRAN